MIKILFIIIISIILFIYGYLSDEKEFKWAAVCVGLVAVLSFVGPYIVEFVGDSDKKVKSEDVGNTSGDNSPKHEHKDAYERKENTVDATCLNAGSYELVSCCECGEELGREVFTTEPLGHNYIATITEPSCEKIGFTTYTCSRCRNSYVDEQTDALDHNFVEEICSRCGTVSSEYEPLIISRANELVDMGKYDEAFDTVNKALDKISSDALQQLLSNIQEIQDKNGSSSACMK